jgi:FkbM family methyltransferase
MHLPPLAAQAIRKSIGARIPLRWRLPMEYYLYRAGADCEAELKWLDEICPRRATAIDIGANIGVYSYKMAKLFGRVYSFEINPDLIAPLEAFESGRISVIAKGLSAGAENLTLHIPVVNRIPLTGWASLQLGNCPDTAEHIEKSVEVATLDSYEISDVCLIKIDVEGHELEVLRGAAHTIEQWRPAVIAEVKERNRAAVDYFFAGMKYRRQTLADLVGVAGTPENFIFLPR